MELTQTEHNILLGTLLGDAFLQKRGKKARLRICHSFKQKEYVDWKYSQLCRLCQRTQSPKIKKVQLNAKLCYETYSFATQSEDILLQYHSLFYNLNKNGKYYKKLSPKLFKYIKHPLSLAVWWLDDGYRRTDCNGGRLYTQCYTLKEQQLLQNILLKNYKINSNIVRHYIRKKKVYYYLSIPSKKKNFNEFLDCISIYADSINCMRYKFEPRND
uniref:Homing endonuclease LAGLIDADG domain-containing protein n=1 Tax=Rhipiliopsis peltata TaxID=2320810 RepID=A0A386B1A6_9CHLO|nr:hypothetical protein [Rhipiliopsis peltata]AYC65479.1 hypothetical protein [Rhipiliopsis peltata]